MRSFRLYLFSVVLGAILLLLPGLTQAAEYTATIVQIVPHIRTPFTKHLDSVKEFVMTGKIYVKGDKTRIEATTVPKNRKIAPQPQNFIIITRPDKNQSWTLNPKNKTYWKMVNIRPFPFSKENVQIFHSIYVEKARMKKIGTETVNGYECDKFEYDIEPTNKSRDSHQFWISKKLGVPIKIISKTQIGISSIELKDIKLEKLNDSLFELPPGYREMKFPGMP